MCKTRECVLCPKQGPKIEDVVLHRDLFEWRKCQRQAGWYGMSSIIIGSSVAFVGLSLFRQVPKKYTPLLSLCAGAGCGWLVSNRILTSCHKARINSTVADINQSEKEEFSCASPLQESKFGDKDFIKE